MLNDNLTNNSSCNNQSKLDEKVERLQNIIDGYDQRFNTQDLHTQKLSADNGKIANLESAGIKADNVDAGALNADSIAVNGSIKAKNFTVEDPVIINGVTTPTANVGTLDATDVNAVNGKITNLTVDNLMTSPDSSLEYKNISVTNQATINKLNLVDPHLAEVIVDKSKAVDLETQNIKMLADGNITRLDNNAKVVSYVDGATILGDLKNDINIAGKSRPKWNDAALATLADVQTGGVRPVYRGTVDTYNQLPPSGNALGDLYVVKSLTINEETGIGHAQWDGEGWVPNLVYELDLFTSEEELKAALQKVIDGVANNRVKKVEAGAKMAKSTGDETLATVKDRVAGVNATYLTSADNIDLLKGSEYFGKSFAGIKDKISGAFPTNIYAGFTLDVIQCDTWTIQIMRGEDINKEKKIATWIRAIYNGGEPEPWRQLANIDDNVASATSADKVKVETVKNDTSANTAVTPGKIYYCEKWKDIPASDDKTPITAGTIVCQTITGTYILQTLYRGGVGDKVFYRAIGKDGTVGSYTWKEALTKNDKDELAPIKVYANKYFEEGQYGIDMQNSDIVNANAIVFADNSSNGEGLLFKRGDKQAYDGFRVENGKGYIDVDSTNSKTECILTRQADILPDDANLSLYYGPEYWGKTYRGRAETVVGKPADASAAGYTLEVKGCSAGETIQVYTNDGGNTSCPTTWLRHISPSGYLFKWINQTPDYFSTRKGRNLMDVFKNAENDFQALFRILKEKSNNKDYTNIRPGDYVVLPAISGIKDRSGTINIPAGKKAYVLDCDHYNHGSARNYEGIVFWIPDTGITRYINPTALTKGGWYRSDMRCFLNGHNYDADFTKYGSGDPVFDYRGTDSFASKLETALGVELKPIYGLVDYTDASGEKWWTWVADKVTLLHEVEITGYPAFCGLGTGPGSRTQMAFFRDNPRDSAGNSYGLTGLAYWTQNRPRVNDQGVVYGKDVENTADLWVHMSTNIHTAKANLAERVAPIFQI